VPGARSKITLEWLFECYSSQQGSMLYLFMLCKCSVQAFCKDGVDQPACVCCYRQSCVLAACGLYSVRTALTLSASG
jgi:hypothetical protein